jgi:hypothetical protein
MSSAKFVTGLAFLRLSQDIIDEINTLAYLARNAMPTFHPTSQLLAPDYHSLET